MWPQRAIWRSYQVLQGIWINGYQPQHFLSNINSFMVSWTVLSNWWTGPSLSSWKKSGIYQCPGHKQWTELIDRKLIWRAMLLVESLTPMTRTLQSVTVAGMFALVPMVLLPRMRSETYVLKFCRLTMDPACLGPLVHAVSICFGQCIHY